MDVTAWIRDLGLERYAQAFQENEVGFDILAEVTAEDLKEIGVIPVGDRRPVAEGDCGSPASRQSETEPAWEQIDTNAVVDYATLWPLRAEQGAGSRDERVVTAVPDQLASALTAKRRPGFKTAQRLI